MELVFFLLLVFVIGWLWFQSNKAKPKPVVAPSRAKPSPVEDDARRSYASEYNSVVLDLENAKLAARKNADEVAEWARQRAQVNVAELADPSTFTPPSPFDAPDQETRPVELNPVGKRVVAGLNIYQDGETYSYRGFVFTSLAQALNYARRCEPAVALPPSTIIMSPSPARPAPTTRPRWVAAGETVEIAGVTIDRGMIYVGQRSADEAWRRENCLIDPTLPVSSSSYDLRGETLGYWCSYGDIRPPARKSYLLWLAGGRSNPDVGIGYVFLFFYGLERRLFIDQGRDELGAITAEVRRLLSIYGENYSFKGYAQRLLDAAELMAETEIARPPISPTMGNGYEIPLAVRRYLGTLLAAKIPLNADDALLWLLSAPFTYLRTPGVRCFEEMTTLWQIRFAQRYPDGLTVRTPKSRITGAYRAASNNFQAKLSIGDLPDISGVSAPLNGLNDLLSAESPWIPWRCSKTTNWAASLTSSNVC